MANIDLRINPARDIRGIKALRLDRDKNRGLYANTTTGFSSRNRRSVITQAVVVATGNTPAVVRRRLRRGWSLQSALTTPQS
jgi:hypothetical protein